MLGYSEKDVAEIKTSGAITPTDKARAEGKAEKSSRNNRRGKNGKVKGLKDVSRV